MRRLFGVLLLLAAGIAAAGGYRAGSGHWPGFASPPAATDTPVAEETARAVIYWRDPDGKPDYSPEPKKTADGRDYLPVYDNEEEPVAPKQAPPPRTADGKARKLRYYRNPMGLPDTSPAPKKDSMGMDYIPVYEGEDEDGPAVKVSLDRVQRTGVRTEAAAMRHLMRPVRAPGVAVVDERSLRVVSLRADGFIEKLHVNQTGQHVEAGQPLFRVYSSDMVKAQVDYRIATAGRGAGREPVNGAAQRLRNFAVPDAVIAEMQRTGEPVLSFDWPSPISGFVLAKPAIEGQMAKAGEELFRIADLSQMWVVADVPEQDIAAIEAGARATITFRAFPGEPRQGRVTFVLHELDPKTRTAKVRIEIANADHRLKHEMYADAVIETGGDAERLAVPASAVIDSGTRQVVLVDRGEGRFEPRAVKLGARGDGYVEVREGVKAGEKVVVAGNFLIDAESNLKAALQAFTADSAAPDAPGASASGHQH